MGLLQNDARMSDKNLIQKTTIKNSLAYIEMNGKFFFKKKAGNISCHFVSSPKQVTT